MNDTPMNDFATSYDLNAIDAALAISDIPKAPPGVWTTCCLSFDGLGPLDIFVNLDDAEPPPGSPVSSGSKLREDHKLTYKLPPMVFGDAINSTTPALPDELIEGILHQGSKMVIGGGSKSYKTWSLGDLGVSITKGVPWWGRATKQGLVVYLNLEVQEAFFHQRLKSIAKAKGVTLDKNLVVWNLRGYCSDHAIMIPALSDQLKELNPVAIILDPTYKVMGGSENAQEEVAAFMNSIERLAIETGASVIFGSHFAKGNASGKEAIDRISGSGVFARDPDAIITMTAHEDPNTFVIDPILRNCPPVEPFAVEWKFPLMVTAIGVDVARLKGKVGAKPKATVSVEDVVNTISAAGGEVRGGRGVPGGLHARLADATGAGRPAVEDAIARAVSAGRIRQVECKEGRNSIKSYQLAALK